METKRSRRSSWYSEKGTEERPCSFDPTLVGLYRCGTFIAYVPKNSDPQEEEN